jgi:hypothetical protein
MSCIRLTNAYSDTPIFLHPEDIKLIKARNKDGSWILLYGAQAVWVEVAEAPGAVLSATVDRPAAPSVPSPYFPGRN